MSRVIVSLLGLCLTVLLSFSPAQAAAYYPWNIGTLTDYIARYAPGGLVVEQYQGALTGAHVVAPLAFEAGNTVGFFDGQDTLLFTNKDTAGYGLSKPLQLQDAYFKDMVASSVSALENYPSKTLSAWRLLDDWTVPYLEGVSLRAGSLLIGYNDTGNDRDYDDFIVASMPTPTPASFLLMFSGLLGLVGFRLSSRR